MFHSTQGPSPSMECGFVPEQTLISLAQAGDEHAFTTLYERHREKISLYLTRLVGRDDIGHELTQETFLRVWRALPHLRRTDVFVNWLYRIATNIAYDFQRQHKQLPALSYDEEPALLNGCSIEGPEDQVEAQEQLQRDLTLVTWNYRICLVLYHLQGYSKQKIAALLNIKESSVGTYISLGLEELRLIRASPPTDDPSTTPRRKRS